MFPQGSAELLCTHAIAFTCVNIPSCPAVFCEALAPVHGAGVWALLHFALFVNAPAPVHAWSKHWQACAVSGLLLSTCVWIPCVSYSTILCSSIVSGLFPPYPPLFFHFIYYISVTGAPFFPFAWGLMAGLPGFASHGSSLI